MDRSDPSMMLISVILTLYGIESDGCMHSSKGVHLLSFSSLACIVSVDGTRAQERRRRRRRRLICLGTIIFSNRTGMCRTEQKYVRSCAAPACQ